jgi:hypothetical protein
MTPTEKHRETAKHLASIQCGADDQCHDGSPCICRDNIARALANAEREGMKRAAEIARGSSGEFDFQSALAEGRDFDYGFHNGKNHAADSILAAIILSEAGEGA